MTQPFVSITLICFNQEDYIEQCIESILAQKVNFTYELIIGDDMSTDNTRTICQKYADKYDNIFLRPRTKNLGVAGNWVDCTRQANGKYIMMLDGDDYWNNPYKMQMQVNFMESHPECVLCHTDIDILRMKNAHILHCFHKSHNIVPPEGMITQDVLAGKEHIVSSSICMRGDVVRNNVPFDLYTKEDFPCEDWPTIVILSVYGEIRYLPFSTTTYRTGIPSITNQRDYDKIRRYKQRSKHMNECLHLLFPDKLGEFKDGWWYDKSVYDVLLSAAYDNNDFLSGKEFAPKCHKRSIACKMAKNKITFQLYRIIKTFL